MSANGTALSASAGNSIAVITANLSGGNSLVVDNSAGTVNITTLNVSGTGNSLEVATATQSITTLDAANAGLTIVLPTAIAANSTVVATTSANIDGASVSLANAPTTLNLGESFTLISNTTGTAANTSATATGSQSATLTYALGGAGKLDAFLGKIQKTGDYSITGPYAATAGTDNGWRDSCAG